MISFDEAKARAENSVRALALASGHEMILIHDKTVELPQGWVFFFNSKEFVETGNFRSALAGNGPIFVSRNGDVRNLPSAVSWQEVIKTF